MVAISSAFELRHRCQAVAVAVAQMLLVVLLTSGCAVEQRPMSSAPGGFGDPLRAEDFAREVVRLLAERDIESLSLNLDPERGLLFSPYGHIDTSTVVTLWPAELRSAWNENRKYLWGYYDGSGEAMKLPIREYFRRFVYDKEFRLVSRIAIGESHSRGSTILNIAEVFPRSVVIEFHVPGVNPKFGGMDWASLYCVLAERKGGGWWLVGLVHDHWTI